MALQKRKQLDVLQGAPIQVTGFTTTASSSDIVTTSITTALSTASRTGGSVPLQIVSTADGVYVTDPNNKVIITDNTTKLPLDDGAGNEIYGRITEAIGVYTLSYYSLVGGTETAYTFAGVTDIDYIFNYRFKFNDLPEDFAIRIKTRNIADDSSTSSIPSQVEVITVTATNTLSAVSKAPVEPTKTWLSVNGQEIHQITGAYSIVGTAITLVPATVGFDIETTDEVVFHYTAY